MKQPPLKVKDFLVSQEEFILKPSSHYKGMLYTYPTPAIEKLPIYYNSEDYISHKDDATDIISRLYYAVKNYNLKFKKKLIQKHAKKPIKTLDYGCGTGEFVYYLNNNGFDAYGIEPNSKANKIAAKKNLGKIFEDSSILENQKFDVITLYHVLEHIPNLEEELEKITQALEPNGTLFIAVPNYLSFDAQYYKEFWAAYDAPRHLWHFSETSIKEIFLQFGMVIESTYPLWFDSFYISLMSEKYKKNKLGFLIAPLVGLISNLKALKSGEYSSKIYQIARK